MGLGGRVLATFNGVRLGRGVFVGGRVRNSIGVRVGLIVGVSSTLIGVRVGLIVGVSSTLIGVRVGRAVFVGLGVCGVRVGRVLLVGLGVLVSLGVAVSVGVAVGVSVGSGRASAVSGLSNSARLTSNNASDATGTFLRAI